MPGLAILLVAGGVLILLRSIWLSALAVGEPGRWAGVHNVCRTFSKELMLSQVPLWRAQMQYIKIYAHIVTTA